MQIKKLTINQIKFCKNYIENGGNGVDAVLSAGYKLKNNDRGVASSIAYENLRKPQIKEYMKELYSAVGLDDKEVEYEHAYMIRQRVDFGAKIKAIDMFYKLKNRYDPDAKTSDDAFHQAVAAIRGILPN